MTKVAETTATSDKKICKKMPVTGSIASKRVCSTQAEWDEFARQGREGVENLKRDGANSAGSPQASDMGRR